MSKKDGRTIRGFIAGLLLGVTLTAVANYELNHSQLVQAFNFVFARGVQTGYVVGSASKERLSERRDVLYDSLTMVYQLERQGKTSAQIEKEVNERLDYPICEAMKRKPILPRPMFPLDALDEATVFVLHRSTIQQMRDTFSILDISCDLGWQAP